MTARLSSFCRNLWFLLAPYWHSEEWLVSWALLLGVLGLSLAGIYLSVVMNDWQKLFYNSFQDVDYEEFVHQLIRYFVLCVISMFISTYQYYFRQIIEVRWRRWLSEGYVENWMEEKAYYRLRFTDKGVDNPDQRIADDLKRFPVQTLRIIFGFIRSFGSLGAFAAILWELSDIYTFFGIHIPGFILWVVLIYSVGGTCITHLIGRPLTAFNREQQQYEADYRFALVRIRENTAEIAVNDGEKREQQSLRECFSHIMSNYFQIIRREKSLGYFTFCYGQVTSIVPYILIAPYFFTGMIQLGDMMQTKNAFGRVTSSFSWFVYNYENLAEWKATIDRLVSFHKALEHTRNTLPDELSAKASAAGSIVLEDFNLYLPDHRPLLEHIDLRFPPHKKILVVGESGCGKTTFFYALCGLWPYCSGKILKPEAAKMLYISSRPYLPITRLRDAVLYPAAQTEGCSAERMREVFRMCGVDRLCELLDQTMHWEQILSLREQQLLAVVRAILLQPDWLFMDEAVSALDACSEGEIYQLLFEQLPAAAIVTLTNKDTLRYCHDMVIDFKDLVGNASPGYVPCAFAVVKE